MGFTVTSKGRFKWNASKRVKIDCPLEVGDVVPSDDSVTTDKIEDEAVTAPKLATDAVETAAIKNANVTTAKLAAGAVTLPKISFAGIKVVSAAGVDASVAPADVTVSGPVAGDRLVAVFGAPTAGGAMAAKLPGTDFEATIAVTGKISQLISDLDDHTFIFILAPATA